MYGRITNSIVRGILGAAAVLSAAGTPWQRVSTLMQKTRPKQGVRSDPAQRQALRAAMQALRGDTDAGIEKAPERRAAGEVPRAPGGPEPLWAGQRRTAKAGGEMRSVTLAAVSGLLVLGACASGPKHLTAPPAGMSLSGEWQLNTRDSEGPGALGDSTRRMPPGGGAMRPPGGGGRGGRGGAPPGGGPGRRTGPPPQLLGPPERLTIEQTDSAVTFRFSPKEGAVVPTNGRKVQTTFWPGAEEVELKGRWTEGGLRLERRTERASVVEVYRRAPDSERLVVTTELPGGRKMRQVYDRIR